MKRLLSLLFLFPVTLLAQVATPPSAISNWPIANSVLSLTDPNLPNQLVGWDDTNNKFIWYTASSSGVTPPVTLTMSSLGTTITDALSLVNSSPASSSTLLQHSPDLRWKGSGWKTTSAGPQDIEWRSYIYSVTDAAQPENYWTLESRTNGASGTWTPQVVVWDGLPEAWGTTLLVNKVAINGTAGLGALELRTQSADDFVAAPTNGIHVLADSVGRLVWRPKVGSDIFNRRFAGTLTGDQVYTWPDATGTVVLDTATQTLTNKSISAAQVNSGVLATARLASTGTASSSTFLRGDQTWAAPAGGGTVTATAGSLTLNSVVLGAGTTDTKVSTGITTDGAGVLTLGVGATAGGLGVKNTNNSAITLVRGGAAAPAYTLTLPDGNNDNLVGRQSTDTLINKTFTSADKVDSTGLLYNNSANGSITLLRGGASASAFTVTLPEATTTLLGSTATGVQTFLTTPSSANLLAAMTDETGTGVLMFGTSPNITTGFTIGGSASTTRKIVVSDGTRFVPSTETWAVPGTSGNLLTSDGTNWTSAAPTVTASSTTTFTNKRVNPRVSTSSTSNTTPTPNADTDDMYVATGMTVNMVFGAPTGTPVDGQRLVIRILGTAARTLSFNAIYRFSTDLPAPSTTVTTKTLYMGFIYNGVDSKWDNVSQMNNF